MNNFIFQSPTELIFGKGQVEKLGKKIKEFGNNILLVTGQGSIKKIGLYDEIMENLDQTEVNTYELSGVKPNPRVKLVREGVKICQEHDIDLVLAAGGGSTVDTSKAIAAAVCYDGDAWEMVTADEDPQEALPVGVILTLAATGSEINGNAVISNLETEEKLAIQTPVLTPVFSILDPQYTTTVPRNQTVYGIVDIASHVYEQYFSHTENTPIADRFAESILITLREESKKVLEDLENYQARSNIMLCATFALNGGICASGGERTYLLGQGKEMNWAIHGIEHEISAIYDIPHGGGLAILFPNWMEYVMDEDPVKFAQYAKRVFEIDPSGKTDEEVAREGIKKTREWFNEMGAPESLADYDIGDENLETMAEKVTSGGTLGGYKELDKDDVYEILKMSL